MASSDPDGDDGDDGDCYGDGDWDDSRSTLHSRALADDTERRRRSRGRRKRSRRRPRRPSRRRNRLLSSPYSFHRRRCNI